MPATITTTNDEPWDALAVRALGRGTEYAMHHLLEANPALSGYRLLPGGLLVVVPMLPPPVPQFPQAPWFNTEPTQ